MDLSWVREWLGGYLEGLVMIVKIWIKVVLFISLLLIFFISYFIIVEIVGMSIFIWIMYVLFCFVDGIVLEINF